MTAPSTTKITPATTSMWALHRAIHRIMDRGATRMTCTMSGPGHDEDGHPHSQAGGQRRQRH